MTGGVSGVKRKWTERDKRFLRENRKTMTGREIASHLGCSLQTVIYAYRRFFHIRKRGVTDREMEYILENYTHKPAKQIADELGLKVQCVYTVANKYGVRKYGETEAINSREPWLPSEDQYLLDNYGSTHIDVISDRLGRTVGAIKTRLKKVRNERNSAGQNA